MSPEVAPPAVVAEPPALLVVDDDRMQRLLISETARRCGYTVTMAGSLEEAVERLRERSFATLVLDLSLGEHDGVEVIRHLAETGQRPTVLVISGFDERIRDAAMRLARSVGLAAVGTLRKPLSLGTLRVHLLQALETAPDAVYRPAASFSVTADDVAAAIENGEIVPAYQPKIELATRRIAGVEALARWTSAEHGRVPPGVFVDITERAGLAPALTRLMMTSAIRDAASWHAAGSQVGVAVNVPPSALDDLSWPDAVEAELARAGLPPGALTVEITESTAMSDSPLIGDVLTRLRIKGVNLALDDFGTGYSSLLSLLRMPFSELKLDRSFVQRCDQDAYAWKIVRASISLAAEFGMRTVAEGVETASVVALLEDARCDMAQGFFFARPMPLDDLAIRLATAAAAA
jgi:EAL domain-containing protein (putative c-di-GMP-specific phosphodiesterase class I)